MKKMNKIVLFFVLLILINLSFVSADLCKGDDGYYHDCKKIKKDDDKSSKTYQIKDYHRELIEDHHEAGVELGYYKSFYDTYEYHQEKYWEYYDKGQESGYYAGQYKCLYEGLKDGLDLGYDYGVEAGKYEGYKDGAEEWYDKGYDAGKETFEGSEWRYKEPYVSVRYVNQDDYYYKPRYDSKLGYYNWRW